MIYGVYFAWSPEDIGCEDEYTCPYPEVLARVHVYKDRMSQLEAYANTSCPASQLITAKDMKDFYKQVKQMKRNFQDESWLEENIYPFC